MNKVLIIGQHEHGLARLVGAFPEAHDHEREAAKVSQLQGKGYTAIGECNGVESLITTLGRFAQRGGPIDILDIFDHGVPGGILIGDEILFHHDGKLLRAGQAVAPRLAPLLAETAHVRLLGCKTGLQREGRCLLLSVASLLGKHCVVLGTLERVFANNFSNEEGFLLELELLYSSLAALDSEAPSEQQRQRSIIELEDIIKPKRR